MILIDPSISPEAVQAIVIRVTNRLRVRSCETEDRNDTNGTDNAECDPEDVEEGHAVDPEPVAQ